MAASTHPPFGDDDLVRRMQALGIVEGDLDDRSMGAVVGRRVEELVGAVLGRVQEWADRGARVWPQVQTRPIDINFTLRERNFMLMAMPTCTSGKSFRQERRWPASRCSMKRSVPATISTCRSLVRLRISRLSVPAVRGRLTSNAIW